MLPGYGGVARLLRHGRMAVFALVLAACDDPTVAAPHLEGVVTLHGEFGQRLSEAGGVRVEVRSSSTGRRYHDRTDDQGRFHIGEVPGGESFELVSSRDGFGDMFRYGVEPGGAPIRIDMFQRSTAVVTAVAAAVEDCGVPCLRLTMEVDGFFGVNVGRRLFRVFLGAEPDLEPWSYVHTDLLVVPGDQPGLVRTGDTAAFELDGLFGMLGAFTPGTTVYLLVHGATENLSNGYRRPGDDDREIFSDLSLASARTSFVMPLAGFDEGRDR